MKQLSLKCLRMISYVKVALWARGGVVGHDSEMIVGHI